MGLKEQIDTLLELLNAAKDDLHSWVVWADEENIDEDVYSDTQLLVGEIASFLHDIGA